MVILPIYILCLISTVSAKCQFEAKPNNVVKVTCSEITLPNIRQEVSNLSAPAGFYDLTFRNSSIQIFPTKVFVSLQKGNVVYLYINNSEIETIQTGAFSGLPEVREIYLQSNALDVISRGCFNSIVKLRILDLSHNIIHRIEVNAFHGSNELRKIFLNDNRISFVPRDLFFPLKQLQFVNLTNNRISKLDISFTNFAVFKRASFNNNVISAIECEVLRESYLDIVELGNNRLNNVDGWCLPRIAEEVILKNNFIQNVSNTSLLTGLKFLDFSNNRLKVLEDDEFHGLKKLEHLQLQQNELTDLSPGLFKDLGSLALLNLSRNSIKSLAFGVFNGLQNLNNLDLSYNQLEVLEEDVFHNLNHLKSLNVSYNKLQYINLVKLKSYAISFVQIDLIGNNIPCQKLSAMFSYRLNLNINSNVFSNVSNVNGIPCNNSNNLLRNNEAKFNSSMFRDIRSFFEIDFKNTSFYQFFREGYRNISNGGRDNSTTNIETYLQDKDKLLFDEYDQLISQISRNNAIFIIFLLLVCLLCAMLFVIIMLLRNVLKYRLFETRGTEMSLIGI